MKILVFGNPYLKEDSLAAKIAERITLEEVEFQKTAEINDLLKEDYDAIMDVAYGIKETTILEDVNKLREHKLISLHDYDVTFFLKLLKELGRLDKTRIIAIPVNYSFEKGKKEVEEIINRIKKEEEKEKQKPTGKE